ncbi:MAG: hypothetical protein QNL91_11920, partial [Candidatus Krumholzibacteria bacterium]|nr:hypothetical protein [Candidatus Krumholzibacteria bacterium]
YTVYKLKRMEREVVRLYLLCFVHDRYQRLNDNLLGAFCALVRRYVEEVDAATKEAIYRFKLQTSEDIEQGAKVLALFVDPGIDAQTPFAHVREQAHALLPAERLQQLCRHLASDGSLDEGAFEWKEADAIMAKVKRNLRPLLRFLSLQGTPAYAKLLDTLDTMRKAFELGEPLPVLEVSTGLIPTRLKRYLLEPSGEIVRDRYEFMVYRQLRDGLEAGDLHCRDSARFRSFDDDLVDDETFDRRAELSDPYATQCTRPTAPGCATTRCAGIDRHSHERPSLSASTGSRRFPTRLVANFSRGPHCRSPTLC